MGKCTEKSRGIHSEAPQRHSLFEILSDHLQELKELQKSHALQSINFVLNEGTEVAIILLETELSPSPPV
jgi:ABC-type polysaccharide/polyol phosphate transport system ATPase subunit